MLLPVPFKKYIPKIFQGDSKTNNLSDKADDHLAEWKKDIIDIKRLVRPDECPSHLLEELNLLLNAGFIQTDSEVVKRNKIYNAIKNQKLRSTWENDAKIRIDNITGLDAKIFRAFNEDDWILIGDGLTPLSYYWATMGADGIDLELGISLIGEGTEVEIAGNIYIDCHDGINVSTLTAEQIEQIVVDLKNDIVPAYMIIYLGYVNVYGQFIVYSGGVIT